MKTYHLSLCPSSRDAIWCCCCFLPRTRSWEFLLGPYNISFQSPPNENEEICSLNQTAISFFQTALRSKVLKVTWSSSRQYTFLIQISHFSSPVDVARKKFNFLLFFILFSSRFETNKSTKGASKLRRDLINAEIANLRDLLPLPQSTRQRLSQLQLMALVCVYVRKANYFQQGKHFNQYNEKMLNYVVQKESFWSFHVNIFASVK